MARLNVVNVARVLLVTHGLDAVWAQVSAVRVPVGNTGHLSDLNVLIAHLAAFSHTKEEWCASAALHQNMQRGVLLSCARAVQLAQKQQRASKIQRVPKFLSRSARRRAVGAPLESLQVPA